MHCPDCRLFFPDNAKEPCKLCGKPLKNDQMCRKCGTRNVEETQDCSLCGASIRKPLSNICTGAAEDLAGGKPDCAAPAPVLTQTPKARAASATGTTNESNPARTALKPVSSRAAQSSSKPGTPVTGVPSRRGVDAREDRETRILEKELAASPTDILLAVIFIILTWALILGMGEEEDRAFAILLLTMAYGYGCHKLGTDCGEDLADKAIQSVSDKMKCTPLGVFYWQILAILFLVSIPYAIYSYVDNSASLSTSMVWMGVLGLMSGVWVVHFVTGRREGLRGRCETAEDFFNTVTVFIAAVIAAGFLLILADAA